LPKTTAGDDFGNVLNQLEDPESALSKRWDQEHDEQVTRRLLEMIRPRFEAKTWQAFKRVALDAADVDHVAHELGMSVNAVFIAKSRVLHLLRQEGQDMLD
jgi:RNA polymerase sigma-70 factor (ECF subfamily)